jgi:Uma2 family endonuclease
MSWQTEATIDDLCLVQGKAELVNGRIVTFPPSGGWAGYAAIQVSASLHVYAERTKGGYALSATVGFVVDLPNRKSFCPDAAFYTGALSMKFIDGSPDFAVEVRSEGDYGPAAEQAMADKRADYFAAGTQVVWDVDLEGPDTVRVFRASTSDNPFVYRRGQIAEAEPAVPGWTMRVDDLFPRGDR